MSDIDDLAGILFALAVVLGMIGFAAMKDAERARAEQRHGKDVSDPR